MTHGEYTNNCLAIALDGGSAVPRVAQGVRWTTSTDRVRRLRSGTGTLQGPESGTLRHISAYRRRRRTLAGWHDSRIRVRPKLPRRSPIERSQQSAPDRSTCVPSRQAAPMRCAGNNQWGTIGDPCKFIEFFEFFCRCRRQDRRRRSGHWQRQLNMRAYQTRNRDVASAG